MRFHQLLSKKTQQFQQKKNSIPHSASLPFNALIQGGELFPLPDAVYQEKKKSTNSSIKSSPCVHS